MTRAEWILDGVLGYAVLGAVVGLWFVAVRLGRTATLRGIRSLPLCVLLFTATVVLWPLVIVREARARSFSEFEA